MQRISPYINRELSWLKFNERVLEEAEDVRTPLFERLKFVSIFQSNLDEFFMVRVGTLHDQCIANGQPDNKTQMTPCQQLDAIFEAVAQLLPRKDKAFTDICKQLRKYGAEFVPIHKLTEQDRKYLRHYFKKELFELISPQIIDKRHPFPFLNNLDMIIGVRLTAKGKQRVLIGLVPVADAFDRIVPLPGEGTRFCLIEDVLLLHTEDIFKKFNVLDKAVFRVTRNADINVQQGLFDEDVDYRLFMQKLVRERKKLCPVRLEVAGKPHPELQKFLCKKLDLLDTQVFVHTTPLCLSFVFALDRLLPKAAYPALFYAPMAPRRPKFFDPALPILPQILQRDVLLCYPFDNIDHLIHILNEAAADPCVMSIKTTLYRVASNSRFIDALIRAKEAGKQVFCVVELRARFDEQNNIDWAKRLEEAGVNVCYGLDQYKTHSKLLLITRKTASGIQHITHVGTGNYNEKTARLYTDFSLLTADQEIAQDAVDFFQNISMGEVMRHPRALFIAPEAFASRLTQLIEEQIALVPTGRASIVMKVNAITDKALIDKLIEASCAGVPIRLIVRSICCLRAGIPGLSENIEVISIVGRYLEHSRIYSFGMGDEQQLYISSGDLMTRSTHTRVEIAAPVRSSALRCELNYMLRTLLLDNVKARKLLPDGSYPHVKDDQPPLDSQLAFFEHSAE